MKRAALIVLAAVAVATTHVSTQAPPAQPAPAGPNTWQIDPAHTAAHFSVKHMMVSTVRGTLGKVTGTIEYDGKSVETVKADVSIDVTGLNTGVDGRDKDLRSENFFDVAKYPTITFKSMRIEGATADHFRLGGDLTMHGVTREVPLEVDGPSAPLKLQNGAMRIGASATTTLNRRDFGLQYSRMMESAPVVGDQVQVTIDIEAIRR